MKPRTPGAAASFRLSVYHFLSARLREQFDGEKPSRQNRRPKRSWKRPPKKGLDFQPASWQPLPSSCIQEGGFCSPDTRRTDRHQCGIFLSVSNMATLSMGATCGASSDAPEPCTGLQTRTFAPTPFCSGRRDSKRHTRNHPMKPRTPAATASFRLFVYHFARRFTGPVKAVRLSRFIGRASA